MPGEDAGFTLLRTNSSNSLERELATKLDELRNTLADGIRKRWVQNANVRDLDMFKKEVQRDVLAPISPANCDPLVGLLDRYLPQIKSVLVRLLEKRSSGKTHDVLFYGRENGLRLNQPVLAPHLHSVLPKTFFISNNRSMVPGKYKQYALWIPLIKDDPRKVLATMAKPDAKAISDDGRLVVETFDSKSPIYAMYQIMQSETEQTQDVYTVAPPGDMVMLEAGETLHFGHEDGEVVVESIENEEKLDLLLSLSSLDIQFLDVEVGWGIGSLLDSLAGL